MTDRQTNGQTDGRPVKNNTSPDPEGGDINNVIKADDVEPNTKQRHLKRRY